MPKFHVICNRTTLQRVVFEVTAASSEQARLKIEESNDPDSEHREVGPFDEGTSDVTVSHVTLAKGAKSAER